MAWDKRGEKQKDKKCPQLWTGGSTGFRSRAGGSQGASIRSPGCSQAVSSLPSSSDTAGASLTSVWSSAGSNSSGGTHSSPGCDLDPRAGLLSFVAVAVGAVCLPGSTPFWKFAVFLALLISINYLINQQPGKLMKKLLRLLIFLVPFFIFLLLVTLLFSGKKATPARSLFNLGQIAARMIIIITADVIFILGQTPEDIMAALHQSHLPHSITNLMTSAIRYFQILTDEAVTSFRARASRETGRSSLRQRLKITGLIIEKIFMRVMDRGQRIYAAMLSRGYEGQMFFLKKFRFGRREVVLVVALVGILLVTVLI
ncbi:MAG TPA: energy-coupling factor transporter transmembrane component T [Candidatus Saccharicenans sp.]|nr:energy-coupling factor transporter transmembrane component T [Candidatus Saccharicenans sp.]